MTWTHKLLLPLLATLFLLVSGCDDDDDPIIDEGEELITNLVYTLVPTDGGPPVTLEFDDPDGDGGNTPVITVSAALKTNTTYDGSLTVAAPDEDITPEIEEEDEDHQFFFLTSTGLSLSVAYADADGDGNPIGLDTEVTTTTAGSGNLTVILRHEPNKTATGIAIDQPGVAGGETDIEVIFPIMIEN